MKKLRFLKQIIASALCMVMIFACFGFQTVTAASSEFNTRKDFQWGINGHNFYYKSYPLRSLDQQIDLAAELGVQIYRINLNPKTPADYDYLDTVVSLCERYGMKVLLVMDDNESSAEILRTRYETVAKRYNGKNGYGTISYIQVFNEVDVWCMHGEDFSDKPAVEGDGTEASHYSKQALDFMVPRFKAAIEGLKAGNPNCKSVINISYTHTYLFDYLKQNNIKWDITGLDWYSNMHDGNYDWILKRLQDRYQQDIFICETNIWPFNPSMESDYENDTTFLPNAMRHIYNNYSRVKAMIFYELLDEPDYEISKDQYEGESHFGFVKVDNAFNIGIKKPIYHQIQRMLGGGPKDPAPVTSDSSDSSEPDNSKPDNSQPTASSGTVSSGTSSTTSSEDTSSDASSLTSDEQSSEIIDSEDSDKNSEETSNKEKESKFPIWPFILIGILVLGGAAAVTVILIRKKQANQNNGPEDQI